MNHQTPRSHSPDTVLISTAAIRRRIARLAAEIAKTYDPTRELVIVAIWHGSFMFMADLLRQLHRQGIRTHVDFMTLASYGAGTRSSGRITMLQAPALPVKNQLVLLVDDILDTGRTLIRAIRWLRQRGAKNVKICVLLDKPARHKVKVRADYVGFKIPNVFVVGYGLDHDKHYRELPYIAKLRQR